MHNLWLVAKHEYAQIVKKKSFLISTLGMPLLMVLATGVAIIIALGQRGNLPLGYVDYAGVLTEAVRPPLEPGEKFTAMHAFHDETSAKEALQKQEIQAYYVLPEDYELTGHVKLFYGDKRPGEIVRSDFVDFLRANLLAGQPDAVQHRILEGATITMRAVDGSREFDSENILNFVLPFVVAVIFIIAVMGAGGYMLQAITHEKESRTIEILASSLRPFELIGGKALGLMSVGLTQLAIWVASGVAALVVTSLFTELKLDINIPWSFLAVVGCFFIPTYALIAGLMTAIGSAVSDLQQGQQISGILNMFFTFPLFVIVVIMEKPNSPLTTALTLFPTTSFFTIILRWAIGIVPLWQLIVSWILLVACAGTSVWIAARVFRMGMLHYGQRLALRHILAGLRGKSPKIEAPHA